MRRTRKWSLFWALIILTSCTSTNSNYNTTQSSVISATLPGPSHRVSPFGGLTSSFQQGKSLSFPLFDWPLTGQVLSRFGERKGDIMNKGMDIQAPFGTLIRSVQDGEVSFVSDELKGFGKVIIVDHPGGFQTVYAHNSKNLVKVGETVKQNDIIAHVGSSGYALKPFLHFEIRKNHHAVDPLELLR